MQAAPKNGRRKRATRRLRGEVIEHFAEVEHAISAILVRAAARPEYHELNLELPRPLAQKRERLRELMGAVGPLRSRAVEIVPLLNKLGNFDSFRNLMAHAIMQPNGKTSYVFRMIYSSSDGPSGSTFDLTSLDVRRWTEELARIAIPLVSKLEAAAKDLDNLSGNPVRKDVR